MKTTLPIVAWSFLKSQTRVWSGAIPADFLFASAISCFARNSQDKFFSRVVLQVCEAKHDGEFLSVRQAFPLFYLCWISLDKKEAFKVVNLNQNPFLCPLKTAFHKFLNVQRLSFRGEAHSRVGNKRCSCWVTLISPVALEFACIGPVNFNRSKEWGAGLRLSYCWILN